VIFRLDGKSKSRKFDEASNKNGQRQANQVKPGGARSDNLVQFIAFIFSLLVATSPLVFSLPIMSGLMSLSPVINTESEDERES